MLLFFNEKVSSLSSFPIDVGKKIIILFLLEFFIFSFSSYNFPISRG